MEINSNQKTTENETVEYITPEQVAQMLNVTKSTLATWRLNRRHLPFAIFGGCARYDRKAVVDYIQRQTVIDVETD